MTANRKGERIEINNSCIFIWFHSRGIKFSIELCKSEAQPLFEDKFGEVVNIREQKFRRISISVKGIRRQ